MNGTIACMVSAGADPRAELWALRNRQTAEDRHKGFVSAVRLLMDLAMDGYLPSRDEQILAKTNIENVLIFEDSGVRLAFSVPGNGRNATPDIAFLGAEFYPLNRAQRTQSRTHFVGAMAQRRTSGKIQLWQIAKL